jgi:hypothetical protein
MPEADLNKVLGWTSQTIHVGLPKTGNFEGLEDADFDFYKGNLFKFEVRYDRSVTWKSIEDFALNLSDSLKLPWGAWTFEWGMEGKMKCKGFAVEINSAMRTVKITDTLSEAAKAEDGPGQADAKRKAFKR